MLIGTLSSANLVPISVVLTLPQGHRGSSWLVGCLMSWQHATVSQEQTCSDKCSCCHTELEAADQTFYVTQSLYTDTRPTRPHADPISPGTWQGSHWTANVQVTGMTRPAKSWRKRESNPGLLLSRQTP